MTWRESIEKISPSNFGFIMATGSLALAFEKTGWTALFDLFLLITLVAYMVLVVLFAIRIVILKKKLLEDFGNIQKMFRYLTFSAGTSSLAICMTLADYASAAIFFGAVGAVSAILMTYLLFCSLFFHIHSSIQAISPFLLLLAITSNSSGIVITTLANKGVITDPLYLLFAFCFWSFGVFIYFIFMTLNMFRMLFYPFNGKNMDPCYWTCMGAAAIAAVDGSQLILLANASSFVITITPFVQGMTLLLWAFGTAWIPILILMELWKYAYFKEPLGYAPSIWAMVFPIGMYTLSVKLLSETESLYLIEGLVFPSLWITFGIWCLIALISRFNPFAEEYATE